LETELGFSEEQTASIFMVEVSAKQECSMKEAAD
jgi:hypothetical protein